MSHVFVLLGSVPTKPGIAIPLGLQVEIQEGATKDTLICNGFPDGFIPVAKAALNSAKWELMKIGLISDEAIHVLLFTDNNIFWDEFESAFLPIALAIGYEVYKQKSDIALSYSFAATGRLSKNNEIHPVKLIVPKLDAAIKELGKSDKVLYPFDNEKQIATSIRENAGSRDTDLIPVSTLKEAFEKLDIRKPVRPSTPPTRPIAAIVAILLFLSTLLYAFWPKSDHSANVGFISQPPGAVLLVDEADTQQITPISDFEIEPGLHTFSLVKAGYQPWQKQVTVQVGREYSYAPKLKAFSGKVEIRSLPSEANVLLDETHRGTTPYQKNDLLAGTYTVQISKAGYHLWKQDIGFAPHRDTLLTVTLIPVPPLATLVLGSKPPGAEIHLDGRRVSETDIDTIAVKVKGGSHKVVFDHPEFGKFSRAEFSVSVMAGKKKHVICYYKNFINVTSLGDSDGQDQSLPIAVNGEVLSRETPAQIVVQPGVYYVTINSTRFKTVGPVEPVVVKPNLTGKPYKVVLKLRKMY